MARRFATVKCACGRDIGIKVFKQHGRRCGPQLEAWTEDDPVGNAMSLLDERGKPWGRAKKRIDKVLVAEPVAKS